MTAARIARMRVAELLIWERGYVETAAMGCPRSEAPLSVHQNSGGAKGLTNVFFHIHG